MTVEHLIGESQGGYLRQISANLAHRFPGLSPAERAELAARIDAANTVTACSFCNATTSRAQAPASMTSLIETAPDGTPEEIRCHVTAGWTTSSPPSAKTWHGSSHRSGRPSIRVWLPDWPMPG